MGNGVSRSARKNKVFEVPEASGDVRAFLARQDALIAQQKMLLSQMEQQRAEVAAVMQQAQNHPPPSLQAPVPAGKEHSCGECITLCQKIDTLQGELKQYQLKDSGGGHVFVMHGNIKDIVCDAWLLPTTTDLRVDGWSDDDEWQAPEPPPDWGHGLGPGAVNKRRVIRWSGFKDQTSGTPYLVLCSLGDDVVNETNVDLSWYLEGVEEFLHAVARDLKDKGAATTTNPNGYAANFGRHKPLVLLPVVGTGFGGVHAQTGHILARLFSLSQSLSSSLDVDISIVTRDLKKYDALQTVRLIDSGAAWRGLPHHLRDRAQDLVRETSDGTVALFLGAGVSASGGLPLWRQLLEDLGRRAAMPPAEIAGLAGLDPMDAASVVEKKFLAGGADFRENVAQLLQVSSKTTPCHVIVSSLPVSEIVTTNYDTMPELAAQAAGKSLGVLPFEHVGGREKWILKMHGCVNHKESIVLTRQDYIRYNDMRAALTGIVQALLLTRKIVFLGFSLTDDNFHRIVDSIRRSKRNAQKSKFGVQVCLT